MPTLIHELYSKYETIRKFKKIMKTKGQHKTIGLIDIGSIRNNAIIIKKFNPGSKDSIQDHSAFSLSLLSNSPANKNQGITSNAQIIYADITDINNAINFNLVNKALKWLISLNTNIIVMPFGGSESHAEISKTLAIANSLGIFVFAAAGNGYPANTYFPARHPSVISVGSMGWDGRKLPECCENPKPDLLFPGYLIPGCTKNNDITVRSGSSAACVLAGGIATCLITNRSIKTRNTLISKLKGGL
ncbi:MAG: S8/S53 family peptidase [Thiothrix sp.]|uniref:S8 family peptidase n=1 Tax=Thiothrix sp. TaxID=1032 RepID=UPI0026381C53|nr:S8/S53 family peptidase [Thiothrix sp.]MDD5391481.1 S8/S53 family peptidase [Thiothrix sp.]